MLLADADVVCLPRELRMWPFRNLWPLGAMLLAAVPTCGAFSLTTTIYPPNPEPPPPAIESSPIAGLKASDLHD